MFRTRIIRSSKFQKTMHDSLENCSTDSEFSRDGGSTSHLSGQRRKTTFPKQKKGELSSASSDSQILNDNCHKIVEGNNLRDNLKIKCSQISKSNCSQSSIFNGSHSSNSVNKSSFLNDSNYVSDTDRGSESAFLENYVSLTNILSNSNLGNDCDRDNSDSEAVSRSCKSDLRPKDSIISTEVQVSEPISLDREQLSNNNAHKFIDSIAQSMIETQQYYLKKSESTKDNQQMLKHQSNLKTCLKSALKPAQTVSSGLSLEKMSHKLNDNLPFDKTLLLNGHDGAKLNAERCFRPLAKKCNFEAGIKSPVDQSFPDVAFHEVPSDLLIMKTGSCHEKSDRFGDSKYSCLRERVDNESTDSSPDTRIKHFVDDKSKSSSRSITNEHQYARCQFCMETYKVRKIHNCKKRTHTRYSESQGRIRVVKPQGGSTFRSSQDRRASLVYFPDQLIESYAFYPSSSEGKVKTIKSPVKGAGEFPFINSSSESSPDSDRKSLKINSKDFLNGTVAGQFALLKLQEKVISTDSAVSSKKGNISTVHASMRVSSRDNSSNRRFEDSFDILIPFKIGSTGEWQQWILEFENAIRSRVGYEGRMWAHYLCSKLEGQASTLATELYRRGKRYKEISYRLGQWVEVTQDNLAVSPAQEFHSAKMLTEETFAIYSIRLQSLFENVFDEPAKFSDVLRCKFFSTLPSKLSRLISDKVKDEEFRFKQKMAWMDIVKLGERVSNSYSYKTAKDDDTRGGLKSQSPGREPYQTSGKSRNSFRYRNRDHYSPPRRSRLNSSDGRSPPRDGPSSYRFSSPDNNKYSKNRIKTRPNNSPSYHDSFHKNAVSHDKVNMSMRQNKEKLRSPSPEKQHRGIKKCSYCHKLWHDSSQCWAKNNKCRYCGGDCAYGKCQRYKEKVETHYPDVICFPIRSGGDVVYNCRFCKFHSSCKYHYSHILDDFMWKLLVKHGVDSKEMNDFVLRRFERYSSMDHSLVSLNPHSTPAELQYVESEDENSTDEETETETENSEEKTTTSVPSPKVQRERKPEKKQRFANRNYRSVDWKTVMDSFEINITGQDLRASENANGNKDLSKKTKKDVKSELTDIILQSSPEQISEKITEIQMAFISEENRAQKALIKLQNSTSRLGEFFAKLPRSDNKRTEIFSNRVNNENIEKSKPKVQSPVAWYVPDSNRVLKPEHRGAKHNIETIGNGFKMKCSADGTITAKEKEKIWKIDQCNYSGIFGIDHRKESQNLFAKSRAANMAGRCDSFCQYYEEVGHKKMKRMKQKNEIEKQKISVKTDHELPFGGGSCPQPPDVRSPAEKNVKCCKITDVGSESNGTLPGGAVDSSFAFSQTSEINLHEKNLSSDSLSSLKGPWFAALQSLVKSKYRENCYPEAELMERDVITRISGAMSYFRKHFTGELGRKSRFRYQLNSAQELMDWIKGTELYLKSTETLQTQVENEIRLVRMDVRQAENLQPQYILGTEYHQELHKMKEYLASLNRSNSILFDHLSWFRENINLLQLLKERTNKYDEFQSFEQAFWSCQNFKSDIIGANQRSTEFEGKRAKDVVKKYNNVLAKLEAIRNKGKQRPTNIEKLKEENRELSRRMDKLIANWRKELNLVLEDMNDYYTSIKEVTVDILSDHIYWRLDQYKNDLEEGLSYLQEDFNKDVLLKNLQMKLLMDLPIKEKDEDVNPEVIQIKVHEQLKKSCATTWDPEKLQETLANAIFKAKHSKIENCKNKKQFLNEINELQPNLQSTKMANGICDTCDFKANIAEEEFKGSYFVEQLSAEILLERKELTESHEYVFQELREREADMGGSGILDNRSQWDADAPILLHEWWNVLNEIWKIEMKIKHWNNQCSHRRAILCMKHEIIRNHCEAIAEVGKGVNIEIKRITAKNLCNQQQECWKNEVAMLQNELTGLQVKLYEHHAFLEKITEMLAAEEYIYMSMVKGDSLRDLLVGRYFTRNDPMRMETNYRTKPENEFIWKMHLLKYLKEELDIIRREMLFFTEEWHRLKLYKIPVNDNCKTLLQEKHTNWIHYMKVLQVRQEFLELEYGKIHQVFIEENKIRKLNWANANEKLNVIKEREMHLKQELSQLRRIVEKFTMEEQKTKLKEFTDYHVKIGNLQQELEKIVNLKEEKELTLQNNELFSLTSPDIVLRQYSIQMRRWALEFTDGDSELYYNKNSDPAPDLTSLEKDHDSCRMQNIARDISDHSFGSEIPDYEQLSINETTNPDDPPVEEIRMNHPYYKKTYRDGDVNIVEVFVTVGETTLKGLIDTGSTYSTISRKTVDSLEIFRKKLSKEIRMKGIRDTMVVDEKCEIQIVLHDLQFQGHTFLIVDDEENNYKVVLGMAFCLENGLTIECNRMIIKKQLNDFCEWWLQVNVRERYCKRLLKKISCKLNLENCVNANIRFNQISTTVSELNGIRILKEFSCRCSSLGELDQTFQVKNISNLSKQTKNDENIYVLENNLTDEQFDNYFELPSNVQKKTANYGLSIKIIEQQRDEELLSPMDCLLQRVQRVENVDSKNQNIAIDKFFLDRNCIDIEDIDDKGIDILPAAETWTGSDLKRAITLSHLEENDQSIFLDLLMEYKEIVTRGKQAGLSKLDPMHIQPLEGAKPCYQKPYTFSAEMTNLMHETIDQMIAAGQAKEADPRIEWNSPCLPVIKKAVGPDGKPVCRIVVDYRRLNNLVVKNFWPSELNVQDCLRALAGFQYFTTMDISNAYYQLPITESSQELTCFGTTRGRYVLLASPQGFVNTSTCFIRAMRECLGETLNRMTLDIEGEYVDPRVYVVLYMDDIIIMSNTLKGNYSVLKMVLKKLKIKDVKIKAEEIHIAASQTKFLGHTCDSHGVTRSQETVEKIRKLGKPIVRGDISSLMGLLNWQSHFLPKLAEAAYDLVKLTTSNKKAMKEPIEWNDKLNKCYDNLMELIKEEHKLSYPESGEGSSPLVVYCDSSNFASAGVLTQCQNGKNRVICYDSRIYSGSTLNWCIFDKEALAIKNSLQAFRPYLIGRKFIIRTDHKPLLYMQKLKCTNARVARLFEYLSTYDYSLEYIRGSLNILSDFVSRMPRILDELKPQCVYEDVNAYLPEGVIELWSPPGGGNSFLYCLVAVEYLERNGKWQDCLSELIRGDLQFKKAELMELREKLYKEIYKNQDRYRVKFQRRKHYWDTAKLDNQAVPGEFVKSAAVILRRPIWLFFGSDAPLIAQPIEAAPGFENRPICVHLVGDCHYTLLYKYENNKIEEGINMDDLPISFEENQEETEQKSNIFKNESINMQFLDSTSGIMDQNSGRELDRRAFSETLDVTSHAPSRKKLIAVYKSGTYGKFKGKHSSAWRPNTIKQDRGCNIRLHRGHTPAAIMVKIGETAACALVDSGCSHTSVSERVIDEMGELAKKIRTDSFCISGASGHRFTATYDIYCLPISFSYGKVKIRIENIEVVCMKEINENYCMILGLDVLSLRGIDICFREMKLKYSGYHIAELGTLVASEECVLDMRNIRDSYQLMCLAENINESNWKEIEEYISKDTLRAMQSKGTLAVLRNCILKGQPINDTLKPFRRLRQWLVNFNDILCLRVDSYCVPVVGEQFLLEVLIEVHKHRQHMGGNKMKGALKYLFYNPSMNNLAGLISSCCVYCQLGKIKRRFIKEPIRKIQAESVFEMCQLDIMFMEKKKKFGEIMIFIDVKSKWMQARPLKSRSVEECAKAFISIINSCLVVPKIVVTDNEKSFTSFKFKEMAETFGIRMEYTQARCSKSKGCVERVITTSRNYMRPEELGKKDWTSELDNIVRNYNTSIHKSLDCSPVNYILNKVHDVRQGPLVHPRVAQHWREGHPNFAHFEVGTMVIVVVEVSGDRRSKKSQRCYRGPYRVLEIDQERGKYKIQEVQKPHETIIRNHCKLFSWNPIPPLLLKNKKFRELLFIDVDGEVVEDSEESLFEENQIKMDVNSSLGENYSASADSDSNSGDSDDHHWGPRTRAQAASMKNRKNKQEKLNVSGMSSANTSLDPRYRRNDKNNIDSDFDSDGSWSSDDCDPGMRKVKISSASDCSDLDGGLMDSPPNEENLLTDGESTDSSTDSLSQTYTSAGNLETYYEIPPQHQNRKINSDESSVHYGMSPKRLKFTLERERRSNSLDPGNEENDQSFSHHNYSRDMSSCFSDKNSSRARSMSTSDTGNFDQARKSWSEKQRSQLYSRDNKSSNNDINRNNSDSLIRNERYLIVHSDNWNSDYENEIRERRNQKYHKKPSKAKAGEARKRARFRKSQRKRELKELEIQKKTTERERLEKENSHSSHENPLVAAGQRESEMANRQVEHETTENIIASLNPEASVFIPLLQSKQDNAPDQQIISPGGTMEELYKTIEDNIIPGLIDQFKKGIRTAFSGQEKSPPYLQDFNNHQSCFHQQSSNHHNDVPSTSNQPLTNLIIPHSSIRDSVDIPPDEELLIIDGVGLQNNDISPVSTNMHENHVGSSLTYGKRIVSSTPSKFPTPLFPPKLLSSIEASSGALGSDPVMGIFHNSDGNTGLSSTSSINNNHRLGITITPPACLKGITIFSQSSNNSGVTGVCDPLKKGAEESCPSSSSGVHGVRNPFKPRNKVIESDASSGPSGPDDSISVTRPPELITFLDSTVGVTAYNKKISTIKKGMTTVNDRIRKLATELSMIDITRRLSGRNQNESQEELILVAEELSSEMIEGINVSLSLSTLVEGIEALNESIEDMVDNINLETQEQNIAIINNIIYRHREMESTIQSILRPQPVGQMPEGRRTRSQRGRTSPLLILNERNKAIINENGF